MYSSPTCSKLRQTIITSLNQNQLFNAHFFAEKLIHLSKFDERDVFLFATILFRLENFQSVIQVCKHYDLTLKSCQIVTLVAQSLFQIAEYQKAISLLNEFLDKLASQTSSTTLNSPSKFENLENLINSTPWCQATFESSQSRVYSCLGQCFHEIQNIPSMIKSLAKAFQLDPMNVEPFYRLVNSKVCSPFEIFKLVSLVDLDHLPWLKQLFQSTTSSLLNQTNNISIHPQFSLEFSSLKQSFNTKILAPIFLYSQFRFEEAFVLVSKLIQDPLYLEEQDSLYLYASLCVELGKQSELEILASKQLQSAPKSACTWYIFGCSYLVAQDFSTARKHFSKSILYDSYSIFSTIALGHSYNQVSASEKAIASYRSALSLFPGTAEPLIFLGMEYLRSQQVKTALTCCLEAYKLSHNNPILLNEIGTCLYLYPQDHKDPLEYFLRALSLLGFEFDLIFGFGGGIDSSTHNISSSGLLSSNKVKKSIIPGAKITSTNTKSSLFSTTSSSSTLMQHTLKHTHPLPKSYSQSQNQVLEPIISNIGHYFKRQGLLDKALVVFLFAASLNPNCSSTYTSIGYIYHRKRQYFKAIEFYHKALALVPDSTVATQLLFLSSRHIAATPVK